MADDNENHSVGVLQELCGDLREFRTEVPAGFDAVDEGFDDVNLRLDGLTHMIARIAGNVASNEVGIETLEETVEMLLPQ